jgi:hypothetical protein
MHRTIHQDDDCPEMGDWITYAMLGVIQFSAMVTGGIAGNPVITLVGAIAIGVPVTFVQALLRHAWNERRRRRRDAAAAQASAGRSSAYDSPSTRRT